MAPNHPTPPEGASLDEAGKIDQEVFDKLNSPPQPFLLTDLEVFIHPDHGQQFGREWAVAVRGKLNGQEVWLTWVPFTTQEGRIPGLAAGDRFKVTDAMDRLGKFLQKAVEMDVDKTKYDAEKGIYVFKAGDL